MTLLIQEEIQVAQLNPVTSSVLLDIYLQENLWNYHFKQSHNGIHTNEKLAHP